MLNIATTELKARQKRLRTVVAMLAAGGLLLGVVPATANETSTGARAQNATLLGAEYDPFDPPQSTLEVIGADPFDAQQADYDPFDMAPYVLPVAGTAPHALGRLPQRSAAELFDSSLLAPRPTAPTEPLHRLIFHQTEALQAPAETTEERLPDPCFGAAERRPSELTINIGMPEGDFPRDYAAACWQQIDARAGPRPDERAWPTFAYHWNATALCHRPLYFEEVNLERYGYGCNACLQPAVSGAHFFGTAAALPYCMVANCPKECVYTLGYYRPGSCPPWQNNYPPCIGVR